MDFLSTQQAAEKLGIDDSRVRRLILDGRLPAQRVGRAYLILEKDLKLVADRKTGRPPKPAPQTADEKPAKPAKVRTRRRK